LRPSRQPHASDCRRRLRGSPWRTEAAGRLRARRCSRYVCSSLCKRSATSPSSVNATGVPRTVRTSLPAISAIWMSLGSQSNSAATSSQIQDQRCAKSTSAVAIRRRLPSSRMVVGMRFLAPAPCHGRLDSTWRPCPGSLAGAGHRPGSQWDTPIKGASAPILQEVRASGNDRARSYADASAHPRGTIVTHLAMMAQGRIAASASEPP
jgi:hypothetical protein